MKNHLRLQAVALRKRGYTFGEIPSVLGIDVPKSTLSAWCKNVELTSAGKKRLNKKRRNLNQKARAIAVIVNRKNRIEYLDRLFEKNRHLEHSINRPETAKISLAMLYLCEGKKRGSKVSFGNSDPKVIRLFLRLLKLCYRIDQKKFRCTIQCRADQDPAELLHFWTRNTGVARSQFYKSRIDLRSKGKPTRKPEYKGVCVVDYLSAEVFNDLLKTSEVLLGR